MPKGVWALGFGSLFMDVSSELIHSLLPVFMVTTLGASMVVVGILEGVAEGTAAVTKVFSGALSDHFKRRKPMLVLGYALGALTKPFFPLATSVSMVFAARFIDRVGKGIRGAPRDALVAEITSANMRGAAYGLRQALDSVGAVLGPVLAVVLLFALADDLRSAMAVAVIPAIVTVVLLWAFVREPERVATDARAQPPVRFAATKRLPLRYWSVVLLGCVFTLARFSEAFLVLRARDVGLGIAYVPAVMIVMNVFYAGAAYPAGVAADRFSRRSLLLIGLLLLAIADIVLAVAQSPLLVLVGAAVWGLHMASTQGLLSKLVADTTPPELLGTGFGIFNLVSGGALFVASLVAGLLWSAFGPSATFLAGAVFALLAAVGLILGASREHEAGRGDSGASPNA